MSTAMHERIVPLMSPRTTITNAPSPMPCVNTHARGNFNGLPLILDWNACDRLPAFYGHYHALTAPANLFALPPPITGASGAPGPIAGRGAAQSDLGERWP